MIREVVYCWSLVLAAICSTAGARALQLSCAAAVTTAGKTIDVSAVFGCRGIRTLKTATKRYSLWWSWWQSSEPSYSRKVRKP